MSPTPAPRFLGQIPSQLGPLFRPPTRLPLLEKALLNFKWVVGHED